MKPNGNPLNEKEEELENDEMMNHLLTKDLINEINILTPINKNNLPPKKKLKKKIKSEKK